MANKYRGEAEIEFAGGTRIMRFDFNVMAQVEEDMGKPWGEIFRTAGEGEDAPPVPMAAIRSVLHRSLHHQMRRLTAREVGEQMDPSQLEYYVTKIGEAVESFFGPAKKSDDPTRAAASAGEAGAAGLIGAS